MIDEVFYLKGCDDLVARAKDVLERPFSINYVKSDRSRSDRGPDHGWDRQLFSVAHRSFIEIIILVVSIS